MKLGNDANGKNHALHCLEKIDDVFYHIYRNEKLSDSSRKNGFLDLYI